MDKIEGFSGQFAFLSNFHPCLIVFEDDIYPSVEHAYQAAKTLNARERFQIRESSTPGKAKRLGKTVELRPDWDSMKIAVMRQLLEKKFQTPELSGSLVATYPAEIIETNNWNDFFWGVCRGRGDNHLGNLLMKIRLDLINSLHELP